jgi:hypothetical protein
MLTYILIPFYFVKPRPKCGTQSHSKGKRGRKSRHQFYVPVDVTCKFPASPATSSLNVITIPLKNCDPQWLHDRKRNNKCSTAGRYLFPFKYKVFPGTNIALRIRFASPIAWIIQKFTRYKQEQSLCLQRKKTKYALRSLRKICKAQQRMTAAFHTVLKEARKLPCFVAFDSEAEVLLVDNGSSASMWLKRENFIDLKPTTKMVQGFGSDFVPAEGIGTLQFNIEDDDGNVHMITVKDAYYVPNGAMNLWCPQQWATQRFEEYKDEIAHCDTRRDHLLIEWTGEQGNIIKKTIMLSGTNVGLTATTTKHTKYSAFVSLLAAFPTCNAAYVSDDEEEEMTQSQEINESEGDVLPIENEQTNTPLPMIDFKMAPTVIEEEENEDTPLLQSDQRLLM